MIMSIQAAAEQVGSGLQRVGELVSGTDEYRIRVVRCRAGARRVTHGRPRTVTGVRRPRVAVPGPNR